MFSVMRNIGGGSSAKPVEDEQRGDQDDDELARADVVEAEDREEHRSQWYSPSI